jgi:hypothetical protein
LFGDFIMDIDVFTQGELPSVLRVLRSALRPDGALTPRERAFLATYAQIVGVRLAAADPEPLPADEVQVDDPHARKRLVQLAALAVLLGRPVRASAFEYLHALARHLRTHDGVIDVIAALHKGRRLTVRMLALRRGFKGILGDAYRAEGAFGVLRFLGAFWFKMAVNRDRLWDHRRLGLLPEGTLGREYWAHMTRLGYGFPGERGGIPSSIAYHDVGHVLAGHDTTPLGEIQQGSFQGGNRRDDGFFFVQFAILHFHQGIRLTPGRSRRSIFSIPPRCCGRSTAARNAESTSRDNGITGR